MTTTNHPTSIPDIRAFKSAYEDAWGQLKHNEQLALAKVRSINDVYEEIKRIQDEQGKAGRLANMRRIQPYIDGLNKYSEAVAIFIQVKPELLSLIWVRIFSALRRVGISTECGILGPNKVCHPGATSISIVSSNKGF